MELTLEAKIEAYLFWKSEPVKIGDLAKLVGVGETEIATSLGELEQKLSNRGLRLVKTGDEVTLGTAPELGGWIEGLAKEELNKDLGKAGLEALTTVVYCAPVTRAEIDYIRGVNSSFILRHLLVRGLILREVNPSDARSYVYKPSFDLLSMLGVSQLNELPNYNEVKQKVAAFKNLKNE